MMPKMRMTMPMRVSPSEYPLISLKEKPKPLSLPACHGCSLREPQPRCPSLLLSQWRVAHQWPEPPLTQPDP